MYGYLKHIKSGQYLVIEVIDSMTYISAVKNYYEATMLTSKKSEEVYFDDYYHYLLKSVSFDNYQTSETTDISEDELEFIECEIILK
jgi:hypothetical protein